MRSAHTVSTKRPTCVFVIEETKHGKKLCGATVPVHELPADSRWPVLCGLHLRTYTSPVLAPAAKPEEG